MNNPFKRPLALLPFIFCAVQFGAPSTDALTFTRDTKAGIKDAWTLRREFERQGFADVYFASGVDTLDAEAMQRLDAQAEWMIAFPSVTFSIAGHTDKVGSATYNLDLGVRRTMRVVEYLVAARVPRDSLKPELAIGESHPTVNVETANRRNRKTSTSIVMPMGGWLVLKFQPDEPRDGSGLALSTGPDPEQTTTLVDDTAADRDEDQFPELDQNAISEDTGFETAADDGEQSGPGNGNKNSGTPVNPDGLDSSDESKPSGGIVDKDKSKGKSKKKSK